jgi:hypothetical protein
MWTVADKIFSLRHLSELGFIGLEGLKDLEKRHFCARHGEERSHLYRGQSTARNYFNWTNAISIDLYGVKIASFFAMTRFDKAIAKRLLRSMMDLLWHNTLLNSPDKQFRPILLL